VLDVDLLAKRLGLEERLYRHRCVEAWAMAVPWIGFPLRKLVELARPLPKARFLRMLSASLPDAPGWRASRRIFPYYEALSLEEATHELAFLATGIYGHALPPQHGAPLRLVVPWKYGFKSLKSIVAFQFTENRPGTFWNDLSPANYGWLSNVDPKETTPWPQHEERCSARARGERPSPSTATRSRWPRSTRDARPLLAAARCVARRGPGLVHRGGEIDVVRTDEAPPSALASLAPALAPGPTELRQAGFGWPLCG